MKLPNCYGFLSLLILALAPSIHVRGQSPPNVIKPLDINNLNLTETIEMQQFLLGISIFVILILFGLSYYIYRLNRKLKRNDVNQRELNQRVLAVVNNTDSIILSVDEKGRIRLINKAAIIFFQQWTNTELRAGEKIVECLESDHARKRWESWIAKSHNTRTWKEVSQVHIKGKLHYFLENFSSITRIGDEYAGMVMVANDITSEHEVNVQIARQHENLEKINKAKERMLSILAHDLKDSIYSAHSMSQLVIESPDDFARNDLLHLFQLFNKNFSKTQDLLNGLLTWMKTQTGALQAKPINFYIQKAIQEVVDSCEEKIKRKGIELSISISEDLYVKADREIIKTVTRNLLSNAIKYSEADTGKVAVFAEIKDSHMVLHVKDNGNGVSKEDQKKLFHYPGYFSKPGTENEKGTGFGLNLCEELLKLHNSKLHLTSEPGLGSDFYFNLPLVEKRNTVEK